MPAELQLEADAGTPAAQDDAKLVERRRCTGVTDADGRCWPPSTTVRDPELDEPVTVAGLRGVVHRLGRTGSRSVRLRLPTYFCAPNFAYLMVADAYDAVSAVEGVRRADVVLEDHFASDTINAGVAARSGFVRVLRGRGGGRARRAAGRLRAQGRAGGHGPGLPAAARGRRHDGRARRASPWARRRPTPDRERLRSRRAELGLPGGDDAPLLVDATTGEAVGAEVLPHAPGARRA